MDDDAKCHLQSVGGTIAGEKTINIGQGRQYCVTPAVECGGTCDGRPCKADVRIRWYFKSDGRGLVDIEQPDGPRYSSRNGCVTVTGRRAGRVTLLAYIAATCSPANARERMEECEDFELARSEFEVTVTP